MRVAEWEALAYLAEKFGNAGEAREAYLRAAREGRLEVFGRRDLRFPHELIPRADWFQCEYYEEPNARSGGWFSFAVRCPSWWDREVRWDQLEALGPRPPPLGRPPRGTDLTVAAIRQAIKDKKLKIEELPTIKDVVLESIVGGSRYTRREARKKVLESISDIPDPQTSS
jgi:hypothetical protein